MDDTRVDDIALFFSGNDKQVVKVWVSHNVYADEAFALDFQPEWQGAIVSQAPADGKQDPHYIANLSNLNDPGMTADLIAKRRPAPPPFREKGQVAPPVSPGDLIVIPWDKSNRAFLVPKARYTDPVQCPPISDSSGADLRFMAVTEGVVLANVPKTDPQGMTCFLLNLRALRPAHKK